MNKIRVLKNLHCDNGSYVEIDTSSFTAVTFPTEFLISSRFLFKINIVPSKEGKIRKDLLVSHFDHDLYKKLKYIWFDDKNTKDPFSLDVNELYNFRALLRLSQSDNYKMRKFSFFNFDAVLKLLGKLEDKDEVAKFSGLLNMNEVRFI